jgi:hypothetical protein
MMRVLTCHHEVGNRSILATTSATSPAVAFDAELTTSPRFEPRALCSLLRHRHERRYYPF